VGVIESRARARSTAHVLRIDRREPCQHTTY
jgi:hypothetical protein